MTWFADLTPCYYFSELIGPPEEAPRLLAIGWLEVGHEFPTGPAPAEALARLKLLLPDAWAPITFMGGHTCSLCLGRVETHAFPNLPSSYRDLLVPDQECVYVTPALITHYIEVHGYNPPPAFWSAVESCPPLRSKEYHYALLRAGPAGFREFIVP